MSVLDSKKQIRDGKEIIERATRSEEEEPTRQCRGRKIRSEEEEPTTMPWQKSKE